jgi:hypothetical protein
MAKKNKNTTYLVLLVILVIIVVVGYQKYGGMQDEGGEPADTGADDTGAADTGADDTGAADTTTPTTTQPLYPDLCYAEGGIPRNAEMGCRAGETSIGDVPGFKVPHICCVD